MTEAHAQIGPLLMGCGIGWLNFWLWCILLTGMIFDEDMESEDMWKRKESNDDQGNQIHTPMQRNKTRR